MNVLVFGGTRLIGKHLVHELLTKGYQVTIATRGLTPDEFGDQVTRLTVERTSSDSIRNNIPDIVYDVVFDSLAYCSNDIKVLLDNVRCRRYIQVSTVSVYKDIYLGMKEDSFRPWDKTLIYCGRDDFPYGEIKRQAECAIVQAYPHIPSVMVRFPYVTGTDDYTRRLYFYVDHIVNQKPMAIDDLGCRLSFVHSDETGKFLAFLADSEYTGTINGASEQTISLQEVADYVKTKTGKEMILADDGEKAPYNGAGDFSMNIDKAKELGFTFTPLTDWIYGLIDAFIIEADADIPAEPA